MLRRYLRAFVIAFKMTLRGEQPGALKYAAFVDWTRQAVLLVDAVYAAADSGGMSESLRRTIRLRLDGRDMNMETILAALRHHFTQEYPYLLRHDIAHNLTAIYASNMNDQYWLARLRDAEPLQDSPVRAAAAVLIAHLDAIPSLTPDQPKS